MNRWVRLSAAVIAMMMIANLQYGWTLFVDPIRAATGWKLSDVQWGFTLFIFFETWIMPCSGWLIDRSGSARVSIHRRFAVRRGMDGAGRRANASRVVRTLLVGRIRRGTGLLRIDGNRTEVVPG